MMNTDLIPQNGIQELEYPSFDLSIPDEQEPALLAQHKEWLNTILRIVPITSAYLLPGDILVGNISVPEGLLYMLILMVFTAALVVCTGKVYRNQLFYRGKSLKERLQRRQKKA